MAYNVAGNMQFARPVSAAFDARDNVLRNAVAERQVANAEGAQAFQQQRLTATDQIAADQRAKAAEQEDKTNLFNYFSHLSKLKANPDQFNATAQKMLQSDLFRRHQIEAEDLTPEQIDEVLPMFAAEAGVAPAAAPKQYKTEAGPRGALIQVDPETGERKQIVGPDNTQAPVGFTPRAPAGYQFTPDGTLAFIPGGPADPSRTTDQPASRRDVVTLRKEFEGTDAAKNYRTVLPLFNRATTAPNTRAGDVSVIYALGKMFDPTSVVREGELILAQNTAPWLQKLASQANSQISGKGSLSPKTRAEIMDALRGQVESFRIPYQQERDRYSKYAKDYNIDPFTVVGDDAAQGFGSQPPAGTTDLAAAAAAELARRRGQRGP